MSSAHHRPRRIAYSSERREHMRTQIGSANYSYVFIEDAMVGLLQSAGYDTVRVGDPEMFKSEAACANLLGCPAADVTHIAFRSSENIRLLRGARNICHFAWEFEVMKDGGLPTESVLADQVHMLRLMDEIWVGCTFSKTVLEAHGLANVHVVPAPIVGDTPPARADRAEALARLAEVPAVPFFYAGAAARADNAAVLAERLAPLGDLIRPGGAGRTFLTILSPGDRRKNLLSLIEGFQIAAGPADVLLVKLAVSNRGAFRLHGLHEQLGPLSHGQMAADDPRVLVVMDYLSDAEMGDLHALADFYLSASHCEGYNLPLLQAMALGTVPVATRNTAMLDYLDADNAVFIAERRLTGAVENLAGDVAGRSYAVGFASRFDVARAVGSARSLSPTRYAAMAAAARHTVEARYGHARVAEAVEARLGAPATLEVAAT